MYYRIISLTTVSGGKPNMPGSAFVATQSDGYYTSHFPITVGVYGKYHPTRAVAYQDDSGTWIVGAETEAILDEIGNGEDLDLFVDSSPRDWNCYKGTYDENGFEGKQKRFRGITGLNKGQLTALGVANPIALSVAPVFAYALQATVPYACSGFSPDEIEASTRIYGEPNKSLQLINNKPPNK